MKKSLALSSAILTAAAAYALLPGLRRLRPRRLAGDQIALITGGSRGLGLALAHRFGRAGFKLILASRKLPELEQARHELLSSGDVAHIDHILLIPADLTDQAQATALINQSFAHFGRIDVLINNAGIIEVGPIQNQPVEAFHRAMQTNFFAALYTTLAALPHLRAGASIVNIASIGGKFPVPHLAPYVAAKFALTGFSETLHAELRQHNIRVTTVCPGLMRTGGESHAIFTGQVDKEQRWFNLGAQTPILAASVTNAANQIFHATDAGRAEITITPQAWLAARFHGLLPETTQQIASLVNRFALPDPTA